MKLRNKKTGEIVELCSSQNFYEDEVHLFLDTKNGRQYYDSLAELNAEWEDYEEPKEYWFIDTYICESSCQTEGANVVRDNFNKEIGNYFETKEEAEKAVKKLKAWKLLKDKGFKFTGFTHKDRGRLDELEIYCHLGECPEDIEDMEDVGLLFGGKE